MPSCGVSIDKRVPVARKLRRLSTNAESKLWAELRNRQLENFKFVRQEPVGPYIGDFVCREARLIIEVDGATHSTDEEMQRDTARSIVLERLGYKVIRVQNDDVYNAMEGVLRTILAALTSSKR
jgi:very-short-patch-repair endonuclease